MIRHEADGADEDIVRAGLMKRVQVVEDVGAEPGLPGLRLALEGERPVVHPGRGGHERRRLEQLVAVGISLREDPRRQRVRREDHVRIGAANPVGEERDEARVVVPALDERARRPPPERPLELLAVARDRQRRVVRGEYEPHDRASAPLPAADLAASSMCGAQCFMPVKTGRPVTSARLRRVSSIDRVQRVRLLDAQAPVAADQILEVLRRDRPASADVRVVGGDVLQPLGRAPYAIRTTAALTPDVLRSRRSSSGKTLADTVGPAGRARTPVTVPSPNTV